jgi:HSP20 family protein|tara:strand:- start:3206 stop:3664 length:459 start_codon:yes stop_codon:yes gene_type:complete
MTRLPTILRTSAFPLRQIDSVFDNLFNDFFNTVSRSPFTAVNQKSSYPRVDIREHRDSVVVDATVPGLCKEDVTIDYEDGHLKVSADKQPDVADDFVHREIHRSAFSRWFSVDEDVYDVEKIDASLTDGILSITIPKKDEAVKPLPRKIEVK